MYGQERSGTLFGRDVLLAITNGGERRGNVLIIQCTSKGATKCYDSTRYSGPRAVTRAVDKIERGERFEEFAS